MGLIGAGKFGSMYLSQAPRTPGIHLIAVADLSPDRARQSLRRVGWEEARFAARGMEAAAQGGTTFVTEDADAMIASPFVDIVIDATGSPAAGIRHALKAFTAGKHIVMVNVEADVLAGPLLARKAAEAGVIYSMASGDQPALIAELVDWARTIGLEVICAGKGTKYLPAYHASTPDTVWGHYGFSESQVAGGDFNPQMFNSFLDGTKSALEMAAVANACGLTPRGTGSPSRPAASTTCRASCGRWRMAAASPSAAPSRWSPRWSGTGGRSSATCAGASTRCSRRRALTCATASPSTA